MSVKDTFMTRLRQLRRKTPSPATSVSRNSDVKNLAQRSAASRAHDVGRQASEIERLVKLAEQFAVDAERQRQSPVKSSTTARAMREQTDGNCTQRQRPGKNVKNDVILVPAAMTTAAVSATALECRRRRRQGLQSTLTLSQLIDVESLERCPKCHKVRLDISSSTCHDVEAAQSRNSGSGVNNPRPVGLRFNSFKPDSPTNSATSRHSRSRRTPGTATEPVRVKTALGLSTNSTFTRSSCPTTTSATIHLDTNQSQGQGRHIPACNRAVVVSTNRDGQQDMNNNNNCESGNTKVRSTWPRKTVDCKSSDGASSTSRGDNCRRSYRLRLPSVWRKRSSLSAVQQMWAEQSMQRTTTDDDDGEVEQNANNSPPSAASSYDPLDTDCNTERYNYVLSIVCGFAFTLVP